MTNIAGPVLLVWCDAIVYKAKHANELTTVGGYEQICLPENMV